MNILVLDGNNLFHKNYHSSKKYGDVETAIDMSIASSLFDIKGYYQEYMPITTILAFDSRKNWRKDYTRSNNSITNKVYKAHRNDKLTRKEVEAKRLLDQAMKDTADILKDCSKISVIIEENMEVDDIASGVCRLFGDTEYDIKIVSSDKDFLQFLRYSNVELINPLKEGKERSLVEWNNDVDLFLFEKCIRGDAKDNVRSSYPRVRTTKIREAYYDEFKRVNLMNHEYEETIYEEDSDQYITTSYKVGDLFEENKILLDLNNQPDNIKQIIDSCIVKELERKKTANFVKFLRFCKKRELNNIISMGQNFIPLLRQKIN